MLIYLCNLTHTAHGLTNELAPYSIGCLKTYLLTQMDAEVELFMDPAALDRALAQRPPDVLGVSNYMWNARLSSEVARRVKARWPQTLVVAGGPNIPLATAQQEAWLQARPWIDVYLLGEAEGSFAELCEAYQGSGDVHDIIGSMRLVDGALRKTIDQRPDGTDDWPRMTWLQDVPSPYLMGLLDPWLADPHYVPSLALNRGCPFTCTYCVSGLSCNSHVYRYPLERVVAEARYIAARYRGKTLYMTDDNFGMYPEDVAFAKVLGQIQEETGWPQWIVVSAGKNKKDRLLETATLLHGAFRVGASVQSTDPAVLKAIRRDNIPTAEMVHTGLALQNAQMGPYTEVIMALPEDTRAKHLTSICTMIDAGYEQVRMHQLTLFDGMEMSTPAARQQYGMETRWRVVQRSYGAYDFLGAPLYAAEVEEVVVANATFAPGAYTDCRRFALTVILLHNDGAFRELRLALESLGLSWSGFLRYVHDHLGALPADDVVRGHYAAFAAAFWAELHATAEEIHAAVEKDDGALLKGTDIGNNLLYNTAGHILYHHSTELVYGVCRCAGDFLREHGKQAPWLKDLHLYLVMTRGHLAHLEADDAASLSYDFSGSAPVPLTKPTLYRCAFSAAQRDLFRNQLRLYGDSDAGLGKIIARSPMRHTYREATPCAGT